MTALSTWVFLYVLSTYVAINNLPQTYGRESPQGYVRSSWYKELTLSEIVEYVVQGRVPPRFHYSDEYGAYVKKEDGEAGGGNAGNRDGNDGNRDGNAAAGFVRNVLNHDVTHALVRAGIGMAPGGGPALAAYDAGKKMYGAANTPAPPPNDRGHGPGGNNGGDGTLKSALTGDAAQKVMRTGIGLAPGGNVALAAYDVGTQLYNVYAKSS